MHSPRHHQPSATATIIILTHQQKRIGIHAEGEGLLSVRVVQKNAQQQCTAVSVKYLILECCYLFLGRFVKDNISTILTLCIDHVIVLIMQIS